MARELKISKNRVHHWLQYEIRGLTPKDLDELKTMDYRDARDKIVEILNEIPDPSDTDGLGLGTFLNCVKGIQFVSYTRNAILIKTNEIVRR